jgi:hypothetical protein
VRSQSPVLKRKSIILRGSDCWDTPVWIMSRSPPARPAAGRYIPLHLITDGDQVLPVTNAICDLMLRQYDDARRFVPAVEWMTYEIIDNIVLHAEAQLPGVVCAQYYQTSGRLEIAVVDFGRGMRASLSESHSVPDDTAAVRLAVTRGVTRNSEIGQGNGLAGTQEIARVNGGTLLLCSGAAKLEQVGPCESVARVPRMPGTAIILELDTRRPVDLTETRIAGSGSTADWNFLVAEGERVVQRGGLRVLDECAHVAGREPARTLRRKIEGILPDLEGMMVLDFDGIRMASSSFLDELLGVWRLATVPNCFARAFASPTWRHSSARSRKPSSASVWIAIIEVASDQAISDRSAGRSSFFEDLGRANL